VFDCMCNTQKLFVTGLSSVWIFLDSLFTLCSRVNSRADDVRSDQISCLCGSNGIFPGNTYLAIFVRRIAGIWLLSWYTS